jgi:hypothetical protein
MKSGVLFTQKNRILGTGGHLFMGILVIGLFAEDSLLLHAQQAQNPSPMVEHTRPHPRLKKETPPGKRFELEIGTLYVPPKLRPGSTIPLFIHFHGGNWLPEVAAAKLGTSAVISVQIAAGSGGYARAFSDAQRFKNLLREAARASGMKWGDITLTAWSAGHGAVREILRHSELYAQVRAVLLIDGLHTGYVGGKPGPLESQLEPENLDIFVKFARDAVAGKKRMIITHSEIFPGTFASTTEATDYLLNQLHLPRRAVLEWGPMKTQLLCKIEKGKFRLFGYAGNSAPDHVDQLHSLPEYLKYLRQMR